MQHKYFIETYGCQMNVYDSELVSEMMNKSGYSKASTINDADAIFLITLIIGPIKY